MDRETVGVPVAFGLTEGVAVTAGHTIIKLPPVSELGTHTPEGKEVFTVFTWH
jgi:hypothetical protein